MNRRQMKPQEEVYETFGQKLKKVMDSQYMTITQLADRLDVTTTAVRSWLKGKNTPTAYHIYMICRMLPITPNELLGY